MTPKFETHALANRLINDAERAAIKTLGGRPAEGPDGEKNLRALARQIKRNILAQVLLGQWSELGVKDLAQLEPLVVIVGRGRLGQAPISVKYDFSKTDLHTLLVGRKGTA